MSAETFDSVFDALADTPAEAVNMTARADLLLAIRERVKAWQAQGGLTREEAAARLGVTRPRLNDLMRARSTSSRSTRWSTSRQPPASGCTSSSRT
jgi:predicted XRE-type DNA-binding protein